MNAFDNNSALHIILRRLRVVLRILELHYDRSAFEAAAGVILPHRYVNSRGLSS